MQRWPARLWLVRHGESAGNLAGRSASLEGLLRIDIGERDADVPLSALGTRQADAVGEWWASNDTADRPEVVIASPYLRAQQTAQRICEALGTAGSRVKPILDERFRERELGMLDRLTRAGVAQLMPEQEEMRTRLGKFYYRPPGGESWCDVILRLRSALDTISLHYAERRVLIVCHQAVVLCLRYLLEELDEAQLLAIDAAEPVANCSITEYVLDPRRAEGEGHECQEGMHHAGMELRRFNFVVPLREEGVAVTVEPSKTDGT